MNIWRTTGKRFALAVVAAIVALTWSQTGYAVAPCVVGRGLDPLDVLNADVRHNVWLVLDTSGSMGQDFDGTQSRIAVTRDVLKEVVNELVDATGRPLFNWGIVNFADNSPNNATACSLQFTNNCVGLDLNNLENPPACDEPDNKAVILNRLDLAVGNIGGNTPNGISMDQISSRIVADNYVTNLLPTQKNFVILVTDGDDTCECGNVVNNIGIVDGIWTPTPSPPFAAINLIPPSLRGNNAPDSSYTYVVSAGGDRAAANAGTKGRLLYERLNPTPADRADGLKGGAFVISITDNSNPPSATKQNQIRRANHMAWEASGAFYNNSGKPGKTSALFAEDREQLKDRLRDIFASIGLPQSEVTLGGPTVGSVREVIPSHTNQFIAPDEHVGDVGPAVVDTDDILEARRVRANHQNNVLFSTTVEVPSFKGHLRAHNIYEVTDDANPRTARAADFTQIWDAGERLQQTSPGARNILFNRRGELLLRPFDTTNVTPADLNVCGLLDCPPGVAPFLSSIDGQGALTANDARDMVVGVIRGYRLSKDALTGTLYKPDGSLNFSQYEADGVTPTWKLLDAVAAPALVLNPPRAPDFDPPQNHAAEYGVGFTQTVGDGLRFYWDHFNRQTMVYLPTNGGMMHGFDGETGDEVFAYIPDDAMGLDLAGGEIPGSRHVLKDLVERLVANNNGAINHKFFLSGPPIVNDAFLRSDFSGDDLWHTVLTFGRARGGRFVTGLDVTNPLNPLLRFNKGNREGISEGLYDGLGETWSPPVMGNVFSDNPTLDPNKVDQWVAFMGAGYGCNNANFEGHHLFALRVEDGSIYYRGQVSNDPTAAIPYNALVAMPTLYNPHQVDVADNKDYTTRVYIGDVQGNIWKLVTLDQDPLNWSLVKFAEVGLDQPITAGVAILPDVNNQRVYVMAGTGGDTRVDATTTDFKFVAYIDNDAEGANTAQYPLGSTPFWDKPLNPEERVYVTPVTIGQVGDPVPALVFFAASKAEFDPNECNTGFTSSLFALGIVSGQAEVDLDTGVGDDESVDLGEGKVTGIMARDGNLYVSESGGLGSSSDMKVFGDGKFDDELPAQGSFSVQVLVDSFRVSPF